MSAPTLYKGIVDTGASCPCTGSPFVMSPSTPYTKVKINGMQPIRDGDKMPNSPGMTCTNNPSPCSNDRTVIATGSPKVLIGGKRLAKMGDVLNATTNIRVGAAGAVKVITG